jgi:hypothetical protein
LKPFPLNQCRLADVLTGRIQSLGDLATRPPPATLLNREQFSVLIRSETKNRPFDRAVFRIFSVLAGDSTKKTA